MCADRHYIELFGTHFETHLDISIEPEFLRRKMKRIRSNHVIKKFRTYAVNPNFPLELEDTLEILDMLSLVVDERRLETIMFKLNDTLNQHFNMRDQIESGALVPVTEQKARLKKIAKLSDALSETLGSIDPDTARLLDTRMAPQSSVATTCDSFRPRIDLLLLLYAASEAALSIADDPQMKPARGQEPDKSHIFPLISVCGNLWEEAFGRNANEGTKGIFRGGKNITFKYLIFRILELAYKKRMNMRMTYDDFENDFGNSIKAFLQSTRD